MALTCREFTESLGNYHAGALNPETWRGCEDHLLSCTDCVEYLRSYKETILLSKGAFHYPEDTVSAGSLDKLVQKILWKV
jgi:hypothetical protein